MGIITAVTPQKKNKSRVNIFIDDEFVCGLSLFTATKFGLKEGKEICAETLSSAVFDSETGVCFDTACRYLGAHRKTVKETGDYLLKKGFEARIVTLTVEKLREYRYLDDSLFVRDYIASYGKKFGTKKLRYELKLKGVDEEIVSEALAAADNGNAAENVARKYMRTHPKADKRKLYAYLYSKGFETEETLRAIDNIDFGEETYEDNDTQGD